MGRGTAIPHARLAGIAAPYGLLARLERPVDFEAIDGRPVDLVCLLLLPAGAERGQLGALACVARAFRDEALLAALRRAPDPHGAPRAAGRGLAAGGTDMAASAAIDTAHASGPGSGDLRRLTLAALGVVYGDIGTSPLYTVQQAFGEAGRLPLDEATVLGALSLIFWSLILVVTVKYVDAHPARRQPRRGRRAGARHAGRPLGRRRAAASSS